MAVVAAMLRGSVRGRAVRTLPPNDDEVVDAAAAAAADVDDNDDGDDGVDDFVVVWRKCPDGAPPNTSAQHRSKEVCSWRPRVAKAGVKTHPETLCCQNAPSPRARGTSSMMITRRAPHFMDCLRLSPMAFPSSFRAGMPLQWCTACPLICAAMAF